MLISLKKGKRRKAVIPFDNSSEAAYAGVEAFGAVSLKQTVDMLEGRAEFPACAPAEDNDFLPEAAAGDFSQSRICGANTPATTQHTTHEIAAFSRQSRRATMCSKKGRGGSLTASGLSKISRILAIGVFRGP